MITKPKGNSGPVLLEVLLDFILEVAETMLQNPIEYIIHNSPLGFYIAALHPPGLQITFSSLFYFFIKRDCSLCKVVPYTVLANF